MTKLSVEKKIGYLVSTIWILSGLFTIFSIFHSLTTWIINLFMGLVFIFIGYMFHKKNRLFLKLIETVPKDKHHTLDKAIGFEIMFLLSVMLFALIIISAIFHRIFYEGMAVFG